jgi:hypothetical protein
LVESEIAKSTNVKNQLHMHKRAHAQTPETGRIEKETTVTRFFTAYRKLL